VMEATGGIEQDAFHGLCQHGLKVAIVNPGQVRYFAKAMGYLEKTDKIDAFVIASYAHAKAPCPSLPPTQKQSRLNGLTKRLRQVTRDMTVNKQRLALERNDEVRSSLAELLGFLKAQAKKLEGEIASLIDDDPLWQTLDKALRQLKGVALRTVAYILAEMPEIGTYDNKAITKLAGLAPMANDSGAKSGKRSIKAGRSGVRSILFIVADIVRRYDPNFMAFHKRLVQAGKPKMVIRTALARKLAVVLNAKVRDARAGFANAT
jgi:transposase